MDNAHGNKNRKLQGASLIAMLVLFALVYNRRTILNLYDPQPPVTEHTPNTKRAADPWNQRHADSCVKLVKNGDLVLRSGSDAISAMFKKVNRKDKSYSHAGIVFIENGYPFVYNCIGSSQDPEALLRRDSLSKYISPYDNLGYAVYRYALKPIQADRLHDVAIRYFKERRTFDPHFDMSTDTALYCTEFVYKAVIEATGDKNYFPITQTANFSFVSVDNLFLRKDMKLVCKIGYKQ